MIPPSPRSNDLLTPKQIEMLRESIAARKKEVKLVKESIKTERTTLYTHSAAIAHLEPTILRAKEALLAHQRLLNNSMEMKKEFERAYAIPGPNWVTRSEGRELCQAAMTAIDSQIISCSNKLTQDIEQSERYILRLRAAIHELEMEVSSRQFIQAMSAQSISDAKNYRDFIEENIEVLKSWLNHVKNIPAEIWTKIFSLRVWADLVEFFGRPENKCMPMTTVRLSHVCRSWRRVVQSQRDLWYFVSISAGSSWRLSRRELLRHFLFSGNKEATLVVNELEPRYYSSGSYAVGPNEASMLDAYSLHIINKGCNNRNQLISSPFRQPKSLQLQFLTSVNHREFNALLGIFSIFSSLEITFKNHDQPMELDLTTIGDQLTYLKIDMTTFQPFDLARYLGLNLRELHIPHDGFSLISPSETTLRLPQLKVLGVTPPDTSFTHSLDLPALKRAILYGPRSSDFSILSLIQFGNSPNFKRVQELELRNWPLFQPSGAAQWHITTPLRHISDDMHSIVSFRCVDSVINGTELVELFAALKDATNAPSCKLYHVTIDCCTGITRDQCDAVGQMVQKLEVYI